MTSKVNSSNSNKFCKKIDCEIIILGVIILVFIAIWLSTYFSNANIKEFSKSSQDWANFSGYGVLYISIINTIIIGFLSFKLYKTNKNYNELIIKPIIISTHEESDLFSKKRMCWNLQNASNHAALNVIVKYTYKDKMIELESKYITCGSIAGKGNLLLFWVFKASKIEVFYTDIENKNHYKTTIINCKNEVDPMLAKDYDDVLELSMNTKRNGTGCTIARLTDKFLKYNEKPSFNKYITEFLIEEIFNSNPTNSNKVTSQVSHDTTINPNEDTKKKDKEFDNEQNEEFVTAEG